MKKKIVVFTGAGVSAESGIPTFRDGEDSLWEKFDSERVADTRGWEKTPEAVLKFHKLGFCFICQIAIVSLGHKP